MEDNREIKKNMFGQEKEVIDPFKDNRPEMYLYVGKKIIFRSETTYGEYSHYVDVYNREVDLYLDRDRDERFLFNNAVIKLDDEVFNRLKTATIINDNEIEIGLPKSLVRGMNYDYSMMVDEFQFEPSKAKSMVVEDVKYKSLHK